MNIRFVINKLKNRFLKNDFSKNLSLIVVGTLLSQSIPLLFMPILSRVYPVEEHGLYGFFFNLLVTVSIIATLRFELAIVIGENENEAKKIFWVSVFSAVLFSLFCLLVLIFFSDTIIRFVAKEDSRDLYPWIFIIPLGVLFNGIIQSCNYWLNRQKSYIELTKSKLILASVSVLIPLILSFLVKIKGVLILSYLFSQFLCLFYLFYKNKRDLYSQKLFIWSEIKEVIYKYKKFPLLNAPSSIIDQLAAVVPLFFINKEFGLEATAYYSMAYKVVSIPISLLSYSVSQALFSEIASRIEKKEVFSNLLNKTFLNLLILGSIPTLILIFAGKFLFVFILGNQWSTSGEISLFMSISAFVKFVVSPLSISLIAMKKLKAIAIWQILYLFFNFSIVFFIDYNEIQDYIFNLMISDLLIYFIYFFIISHSTKKYKFL